MKEYEGGGTAAGKEDGLQQQKGPKKRRNGKQPRGEKELDKVRRGRDLKRTE